MGYPSPSRFATIRQIKRPTWLYRASELIPQERFDKHAIRAVAVRKIRKYMYI